MGEGIIKKSRKAKNLDALGFVELYFNPDLEGRLSGICWLELDTCAQYSFFEPMTESQRGTPRDQSAWVLEEFPDRPNAVRWTYRITDKDYKEAVRQTLERWADRDEEKQPCQPHIVRQLFQQKYFMLHIIHFLVQMIGAEFSPHIFGFLFIYSSIKRFILMGFIQRPVKDITL